MRGPRSDVESGAREPADEPARHDDKTTPREIALTGVGLMHVPPLSLSPSFSFPGEDSVLVDEEDVVDLVLHHECFESKAFLRPRLEHAPHGKPILADVNILYD